MKKLLYTLLVVSFIFTACKKEEDEVVTPPVVNGCTDANANNYNSSATNDDGSCTYDIVSGCMDSIAFNYNLLAIEDDGSCDYRVTGGKWIQFSESIDVTVIVWADENQTQFIDSMSISEYESNADSLMIKQIKFFINGNVKTYDQQGMINQEGNWTENEEGTLTHSITIIDSNDGEQIIFNVDNISEDEMYLNQDLDVFEYESEDDIWIQYLGKQYFSFDRDENGLTSDREN